MQTSINRRNIVWALCIIGLLIFDGCAKKMQTLQVTEVHPASSEGKSVKIPAPPSEKKAITTSAPSSATLEDLFFGFDKALLTSEDLRTLNNNVVWLKNSGSAKITIEGHCDERGTAEYNLVLGENRATAAKRYLESVGIDSNRITTISYGTEKPFCNEHNEQCWKQNRRDHFSKMGDGG